MWDQGVYWKRVMPLFRADLDLSFQRKRSAGGGVGSMQCTCGPAQLTRMGIGAGLGIKSEPITGITFVFIL